MHSFGIISFPDTAAEAAAETVTDYGTVLSQQQTVSTAVTERRASEPDHFIYVRVRRQFHSLFPAALITAEHSTAEQQSRESRAQQHSNSSSSSSRAAEQSTAAEHRERERERANKYFEVINNNNTCIIN